MWGFINIGKFFVKVVVLHVMFSTKNYFICSITNKYMICSRYVTRLGGEGTPNFVTGFRSKYESLSTEKVL